MVPDPNRPLEWWEQAQLAMLEAWTQRTAPEYVEFVQHLRQHPNEWRAFRARLKKESE
jgi:hypothetical protein